jgi:kynurenine 3-monooxygenase
VSPRTLRDTSEITLVGAGLAGSLLAIFLAKRGYRVTILERRPDPRKAGGPMSAGRSINLALANRGIAALEEVGVMESIGSMLIPMAGRMLHDEEGRLKLIPYGNKPHEVIHSVSRAGLNTLLLSAAESTGRVSVRFEETVREVDFEKRQVQGTPYDVLIGTDGSASAVRSAILARTGGRLDEEPLGHGYKELTIPASPDGAFRMEKNALHIWPRGEYMLIALPNAGGSFTATLFLPNRSRGEESFESLTTPAAVLALFERRFADAIPLMPGLSEDFFGNPTGHLETIRCEPWSFEDQALVLGDAAHAIVPFHGQGMNAAFEDCSAFDRCLRQSAPDRPWNEVFAEFEKLRRPDTDAIADMALENYVEMRSTVREPKFQLKKDLSFRLEERHPGRFIPRYSMVMFHTIPYAEAKRRGAIQEEILDELTSRAASLEEIDLGRADRLIADRLGSVE